MNKRTARLLLALLIVIILAVGGYYTYKQFFTFYSTGTTPDTENISVIAPYIDINFNKSLLDDQELTLVDEKFVTRGYKIQDKTIRIELDELKLDQEYTLSIEQVTSHDDRVLENVSVSFTTKDIPYLELSKAQQEYILEQQNEQPYTISDPILTHVPHSTLDFELRPVIRETFGDDEDAGVYGELVLEARLLLTAADMRIDEAGAIKQYSEEVREYIRSLGLNPDDYKIEYVPVRPVM